MNQLKLAFLSCLLLWFAAHCTFAEGWKRIGPSAGTIHALMQDPNDPDTWYAVNEDHLYVTRDDARTWKITDIAGTIFAPTVANANAITIHPQTGTLLVVTSNHYRAPYALWKSEDHGATFSRVRTFTDGLERVLFDPHNSRTIWGIWSYPKYGLRVSSDGGVTWKAQKDLWVATPEPCKGCTLSNTILNDIFIDPAQPDTVLLSGSQVVDNNDPDNPDTITTSALWTSRNAGGTWKGIPFPGLFFYPVASQPGLSFAHGDDGLYIIQKGRVRRLSGFKLEQMSADPANSNTLYGARYDSIYRSVNAGKTWSVLPIHSQAIDVRVYARTDGKLMIGTDGAGVVIADADGVVYRTANEGFQEGIIFSLSAGGSAPVIYASVPNGGRGQSSFLYRYDPVSQHWRNLTANLPERFFEYTKASPVNPDLLILSSVCNGLYVSNDRGITWTHSNLPSGRFCDENLIDFNPLNPRIVYASTRGLFYRSTDGGITFRQLDLTRRISIGQIVADQNDEVFFFIDEFAGLLKSDGKQARLIQGFPPGCEGCDSSSITSLARLSTRGGYIAMVYVDTPERDNQGYIYRTLDGGDHWELIGRGPGGWAVPVYAADPLGMHLFAVELSIHESSDGGKTWKDISPAGPVYVYDVLDPSLFPLYIGTNRGVFSRE